MIRLKQKKAEEEKKAAADAENQAQAGVSADTTVDGATAPPLSESAAVSDAEVGEGASSGSGGGLKLLGIGGKSTRTNGEGVKTTGKKKTPGEIRIQKGSGVNTILASSSIA